MESIRKMASWAERMEASVPDELRSMDRWLVWRYENRRGRQSKIPRSPTGLMGSSQDPRTWGTFDEAVTSCLTGDYEGVGIALGGIGDGRSLCGIDLDKCRNVSTGELEPWAADIIEQARTYCEVSPSGTGVKMFTWAHKPPGSRSRVGIRADGTPGRSEGDRGIEVYDSGRYFTVTGDAIGECRTVSDGSMLVAHLCTNVIRRGRIPASTPTETSVLGGGMEDDDLLLRTARSSKDGARFSHLYDTGADADSSASEATADMLLRLAFWTGKDASQMDRLFRGSALFRDKWNSRRGDSTWGAQEIDRAIGLCKSVYSGRLARRPVDSVPGPDAGDGAASMATGGGSGPSSRPLIYTDDDIGTIISELDRAIAAQRPRELYQRSGRLVQVISGRGKSPHIRVADRHWVRVVAGMAAQFVRPGGKDGPSKCHPPAHITDAYFSSGRWQLDEIKGIVGCPQIRPDGTVLSEPGFDAATGLYYDPCGVDFPDIPPSPSLSDAKAAVARLVDPVTEFDFARGTESGFLAMLLTAVGRSAIEGVIPAFIVDASSTAAGKTKLCQCVSIAATGSASPCTSLSRNEDERRKAFMSIAIGGYQLALFDNVKGVLGGPTLESAITAGAVRDRILGRSEQVSAPWTQVIMVTGNQMSVSEDLARRIICVKLEPTVERPEDRSGFRIPNLERWYKEHRSEVVADALTIMLAYHHAGRPPVAPPMGSFEEWSTVVRSALVWAGVVDPYEETMYSKVDNSPEMDESWELLEALYEWRGHEPFTSRLIAERLYEATEFDSLTKSERHLAYVLEKRSLWGRRGSVSVGQQLKTIKDRRINGFSLVKLPQKSRAKAATWAILAVE